MLYDKDIREPLFEFLEERYGKVRILEEKRMGRSRADAVMIMVRRRRMKIRRCWHICWITTSTMRRSLPPLQSI